MEKNDVQLNALSALATCFLCLLETVDWRIDGPVLRFKQFPQEHNIHCLQTGNEQS